MMSVTYSDGASAAGVDQLNDRVGVIGEISGEGVVRKLIAIVGDGLPEVRCNLLGILVVHASRSTTLESGDSAGRKGSDGEADGTHLEILMWFRVVRRWYDARVGKVG